MPTDITVQKVWTQDVSGNDKTSFVLGDDIHYLIQVKNPGSTTVTATFTFVATSTFIATGSRQIFSWSGPGEVAPGTPGFYSPSTIPSDTPSGEYTLTVKVEYNGVSSSGESTFTVTPPHVSRIPAGKAPNLIVLVHGCCTDADDVRDVWDSLGWLIEEKIIQDKTPDAWEIVVWDWHDDTPKISIFPLPPDKAYENAIKQGRDVLAPLITNHHYDYVHLIAHSAGSNLIDTVATELFRKSIETGHKPFIHLTFLDAFTPHGDEFSYGANADYAEHYVDRGLTDTDACLWNAFNFDITNWTPDKDCSDLDLICRHKWPIHWYTKSIMSTSPKFKYGYPLSLEGGVATYTALSEDYPDHRQCHLTDVDTKCQTRDKAPDCW